jgi:hypothetical protein
LLSRPEIRTYTPTLVEPQTWRCGGSVRTGAAICHATWRAARTHTLVVVHGLHAWPLAHAPRTHRCAWVCAPSSAYARMPALDPCTRSCSVVQAHPASAPPVRVIHHMQTRSQAAAAKPAGGAGEAGGPRHPGSSRPHERPDVLLSCGRSWEAEATPLKRRLRLPR